MIVNESSSGALLEEAKGDVASSMSKLSSHGGGGGGGGGGGSSSRRKERGLDQPVTKKDGAAVPKSPGKGTYRAPMIRSESGLNLIIEDDDENYIDDSIFHVGSYVAPVIAELAARPQSRKLYLGAEGVSGVGTGALVPPLLIHLPSAESAALSGKAPRSAGRYKSLVSPPLLDDIEDQEGDAKQTRISGAMSGQYPLIPFTSSLT